MVEFVKPKAILVAQTKVLDVGMDEFKEHLGCPEWETDGFAEGTADELSEIGGRLCYKSFEPGMNPNVTKVREGNKNYIGNILKHQHGSVVEHGTATFMFMDVTRVFTHEIVRHRVGTAFSQESLRYVRLDNLKAYYPDAFIDDVSDIAEALGYEEWEDHAKEFLREEMTAAFTEAEERQKRIAEKLGLDQIKNFNIKKRITSSMRRMAPIGLCTNIMVTANHRTWRNIIEQRCNPHAEEEINTVIRSVALQLKEVCPSTYQDMVITEDTINFENRKI